MIKISATTNVKKSNVSPLLSFYNLISSFENNQHRIAIDLCHNVLLFGMALSTKPENVIELGVGTGFVTKALLHAIEYNQKGKLTCVDCYKDFDGKEPAHFKELKELGANIIFSTEENFTKSQLPQTYDFLVSDADHRYSLNWIDKTLQMMKPNSPMFFHDTNNTEHLKQTEHELTKRGISSHTFKISSLPNERCERGWLLAFNHV